ncbi:hypothetical protein [Mesorhizobium sp. NZP2077]|uniref:hypothetical protein n=1 Tax=Mesorhizobium sp. NZP2077 TaxID=2483404 RepID=UPI0015564C8B|nr:hypothetical protein [Mesorhizobium sp. NZP2077]QKD16893.1 hypothetical protein HGP13_18440 [Mesorhizobium sp. NZP2077]
MRQPDGDQANVAAAQLPFRHVASLALVVAASAMAGGPPVHYAARYRILRGPS